MRVIMCIAFCLLAICGMGQQPDTKSQPHKPANTEAQINEEARRPDSEDIDQLQRDVQQLRVLVNQMRNNLAFVQTSQTPLKHQFELEADAWQVLIDQMDRHLRNMQGRGKPEAPPQQ